MCTPKCRCCVCALAPLRRFTTCFSAQDGLAEFGGYELLDKSTELLPLHA